MQNITWRPDAGELIYWLDLRLTQRWENVRCDPVWLKTWTYIEAFGHFRYRKGIIQRTRRNMMIQSMVDALIKDGRFGWHDWVGVLMVRCAEGVGCRREWRWSKPLGFFALSCQSSPDSICSVKVKFLKVVEFMLVILCCIHSTFNLEDMLSISILIDW